MYNTNPKCLFIVRQDRNPHKDYLNGKGKCNIYENYTSGAIFEFLPRGLKGVYYKLILHFTGGCYEPVYS